MDTGRFSTDVYAGRLRAATAAAADAALAGLVITPGYDLRYLVGSRAQTFERLTALVLPADGEPTVVVPRMELASLKDSAVLELGLAVRDWVDGDDPYRLVADAKPDDIGAHLRACGVEIIDGPVAKSGAMGPMTSHYCRDPDGNLVEVASYWRPD